MSRTNAIVLNNQAVVCLQQHKAQEAAGLFRSALKTVHEEHNQHHQQQQLLPGLDGRVRGSKRRRVETDNSAICQSLSSLPQEGTQNDASNHLPEDFSFSSFASTDSDDGVCEDDMDLSDVEEEEEEEEEDKDFPPVLGVPVLADVLERQHKSFDNAFMYLFDRALTISSKAAPEQQQGPATYDETENTLTTAIVMYNMALVHHTRGMSKGKSTYLTKATQLYQLSLHMVQKAVEAGNAEPTLLVLANLNNLAQINSLFCLNHKMNSFVESMKNVLADCDSDSIDEKDYSWFFMNILFFHHHGSHAFAAAPAA